MDSSARLGALPMDLRWDVLPVDWTTDGEAALTITAGARTDLFVDPEGVAEAVLNAPRALGVVDGDFMLSALVRVGFGATYDAGVLQHHAGERAREKLCFERSPRGEPMVVSVVTRGVSDDANGFTVDGERIWLRISRLGRAYAFHASVDGTSWSLVRHFALDGGGGAGGGIAVGFEAQSPVGDGCTAVFQRIRFEARRLGELRSGE
jgi:regulation of enolase protein 1 (concanavalin A-like superfamily)